MKKRTPNTKNSIADLSPQIIHFFCLLFFLINLFSCAQKSDKSTNLVKQKTILFNAIPTKLPPPIKAKYLDPNNIAPPTIIPLKKPPKVVQAHPNVHPVGAPKVIQIPKNLSVTTLGKNGAPSPIIIPAKKRVIRALQPNPIPALAPVYKDDAIYDINYLSDKQGLSVGGLALLADSRGNIWFGGEGGLVRYDGKHFFHYTKKEGFMNSIRSLMEDKKGNIWMAGYNGICSYDGQNVTHYTIEKKVDNPGFKLSGCSVQLEDSKGNIWFGNLAFGADGSGVYRFDGQDFTVFEKKIWKHLNEDRKQRTHINEDGINKVYEDSRGHFWWATQGSGVMRYDGQQITHYTRKEGLIGNYISTILEDKNGQIWFGSSLGEILKKGLSCYKPNPDSPNGIGGTFTNFTKKEGLSDDIITGIIEDASGNLWISTYGRGLNRYDGKNFIHFKAEEGLGTSLLTIIADSKGNIWTGSVGENAPGGAPGEVEIHRLKPKSFRHFTEKQGLSKPAVSGVLEDSKGNTWISVYAGGAVKYEPDNNGGIFTHFTEEQGLCDDEINTMMEDSKGNLWFATVDEGVSCFDGKVFTNYTIGQGLSFDFVWDIKEDYLGNIWFACGIQGGIIRLNPATGQFTHFTEGETVGIQGANLGLGGSSIQEDSQHNLWFGGAGWVAKYDSLQDQIDLKYQIDAINKEWVEYMIEDEQQNLWFGTESRLVQIKKETEDEADKFTLFNKENGLPDLRIQSITVDKQNNIWISSDKGLAVMEGGLENIGKREWIQFDKSDGLKSNGYVCTSAYLDSKNQMWWGTGTAGLTMLDLNTFSLPTTAPENLSLSHIEINQEFLDYGNISNTAYKNTLAFGERLNQSFDSVVAFQNYPTTLNLPYDLNHLTFHFSAIDWSASHKIQYSYQMEGLDKEWSNLQTKTEADYRNLPYGTFTFKLKAIGEAQVWSVPFEYTFTILPPWWHTWWAYALYAVLAFGISGWYIQRLRQQINQKEQQLNRELYLNQELAVTNNKLAKINVANSRFVPNDFLQILGKDSLLDLQLGDQTEATMTILFADIRDYTGLSEKITPEENFKLINAFLGRMGPIIQKNGGFICQYFGDGIMALFKENHDLAINAAIEMQLALQRYNKKRFVRNRQALRVGIGLNTGKLMLGVIGDTNRYESSVISDAVNTASRMEGLTKIFGCSVIVSEKTLAEIESTIPKVEDTLKVSPTLAPEAYRFLGKVKVKGKNQTLEIYDFFHGDAPNLRQLKSETKADFEKAIYFYFDRQFGKAADLLKTIAVKFPEDIATEYYLNKAIKYVIDGVDTDWNGVEKMINK